MNRRGFLKSLGLAVAGAAIASKVELIESIIPIEAPVTTIGNFSASSINFTALEKAYRRACVGSVEPDLILIHIDNYTALQEYIKPQLRFTNVMHQELGFEGMRFHSAITTYGNLESPQDPMLRNLKFKLDDEIPVLFGVKKDYINITPHYQNFYREFI